MSKVCFHCGSTSGSWVKHDDKWFCCNGCVVVYDILQSSNMDAYYSLEATPGVKAQDEYKQVYSYLDEEEIKKTVLDFRDGDICKIRVHIPAIHCSSCIWLLENLDKLHSGVLNSSVHFHKKELSVSYNESKIKLSELMSLLESIHYKPRIQKLDQKKDSKQNKRLVTQLGVAGFAFGNVMLLSFPEYLSTQILSEELLKYTFSYLSVLLCLPVLFYSAADYFMAAWKSVTKKIVSIDVPIAIGISAIFFRSLYDIISNTGPGYLDSLTGLVFFLLIGKWYQARTYRALSFDNDYTSFFPLGVTKLEGGVEKVIPIHDVLVGDEIFVRNGEIIPADSILLSDEARIDYSFITGESIPVRKQENELIYAGGKLVGKSIRVKVEKKLETAYLAQLWKDKPDNGEEHHYLSETMNKVSKNFTLAILTIAVITAVVWFFIDPTMLMFTFSAVLIVACPCALALSIPFTFGHTQQIFGTRKFFLQNSILLETLSKIKVIVFDKTGTLTQTDNFDIELSSKDLTKHELSLLKSVSQQSSHPLSRAIFSFIEESESLSVDFFEEISGKGIVAKIGGDEIRIGAAHFIKEQDATLNSGAAEVHFEINRVYKGVFYLRNQYRDNWKNLLKSIGEQFEIHLLSGDNDNERGRIKEVIPFEERLHFNQSPFDKKEYIERLRKERGEVMMIGDGLNDTGALMASDFGVAIVDSMYRFSPAGDAILDAESFSSLSKFIRFAKSSMRLVYASFGLSFLYNVVGIYFAASGQLTPLFAAILMPLSSVSIVVFTSLGTHAISRFKYFKKA